VSEVHGDDERLADMKRDVVGERSSRDAPNDRDRKVDGSQELALNALLKELEVVVRIVDVSPFLAGGFPEVKRGIERASTVGNDLQGRALHAEKVREAIDGEEHGAP
jgi:hypothetical protein